MLSAQGPLARVALAIFRVHVRTRVYVDGFNLYCGAVKETPFKWLNPVLLSRPPLLPAHTIDRLLHFTACLSGISDPGAPTRQQTHFDALRAPPEVEVHFGNFLASINWRPTVPRCCIPPERLGRNFPGVHSETTSGCNPGLSAVPMKVRRTKTPKPTHQSASGPSEFHQPRAVPDIAGLAPMGAMIRRVERHRTALRGHYDQFLFPKSS